MLELFHGETSTYHYHVVTERVAKPQKVQRNGITTVVWIAHVFRSLSFTGGRLTMFVCTNNYSMLSAETVLTVFDC